MLQHDVLDVDCCLLFPRSCRKAFWSLELWRETFRFPHFEKVFLSVEWDFFHFPMPEKVSFQGLQDFSAGGAVKCLLPGNRRPSQQEGNVKKLCVWAVGKILTSNFPSLELQFFDGKLKQYSLFVTVHGPFRICAKILFIYFLWWQRLIYLGTFIQHYFVLRFHSVGRCWDHQTQLRLRHKLSDALTQRGQFILFSVVFTPSPPGHHGSVWLLPVISLLLANTVSPVRACLIIWWERFCGTQKEDDRGPLSIQSSLLLPIG